MRILARQFVMGRTIEEALDRARPAERARLSPFLRHARRGGAHRGRRRALSRRLRRRDRRDRRAPRAAATVEAAPGISVKLSALHPRYEMAQRERVLARTAAARCWRSRDAGARGRHRLHDRCRGGRPARPVARSHRGAGARRPSSPAGTGSASRCRPIRSARLPLIDWLAELARRGRRRLMVRLVKGAYWDSEIKRSQERGLDGYPVFTRKLATDVSYLACAQPAARRPAAPSIRNSRPTTRIPSPRCSNSPAAARDWEFQRLHGMGEALYDEIVGPTGSTGRAASMRRSAATRICWPISCGGCSRTAPTPRSSTASSTSAQPIDEIVADPVARLARLPVKPHPRIPLPRDLYAAGAAQFARASISPIRRR